MLWAITSYFNPLGYRTRPVNYRRFRQQLGVPLLTVEASSGGAFDLGPGDADVLVQRRGGSLLWQKERMLNIALEHLPPECDSVVWVDCDVIFTAADWPERTREALERHALVQPFSRRRDLGPAGGVGPAITTITHPRELVAAQDLLSFGAPARHAFCGFAWAARRALLDAAGFYDACIIGGADRAMACAAVGDFAAAIDALQMNVRQQRHYVAWAQSFADLVGGSVGYVSGTALHLWHGDLRLRRYRVRHAGLARHRFDPAADIAVDTSGCWVWSSDKPALHDYVRGYFAARLEDCSSQEEVVPTRSAAATR